MFINNYIGYAYAFFLDEKRVSANESRAERLGYIESGKESAPLLLVRATRVRHPELGRNVFMHIACLHTAPTVWCGLTIPILSSPTIAVDRVVEVALS